MKKMILVLFLVLCLSPCRLAFAAPIDHVSYDLSFAGKMSGRVPEPGGRWLDEVFALVDIRAERIFWEDGALTELEFRVGKISSCSLGILVLEEDVYLCGTLFPEVPLLTDATQRDSALRLIEAFFSPEDDSNELRESLVTYLDLRTWMESASHELAGLAPDEDSMTQAISNLLTSMADVISEEDDHNIALQIKRRPVYQADVLADDTKNTADVAIERLLTSLIASMTLAE